jgi:hypothetical protein
MTAHALALACVVVVLGACSGSDGPRLSPAPSNGTNPVPSNGTNIDSGAADGGGKNPVSDAAPGDARQVTPLTFCAGTPVAGTCGQRFFQDISECMSIPNLVDCKFDAKASSAGTYCFQGGARVVSTSTGAQSEHSVWMNSGGVVCLESDTTNTSYTMTRDGQTLSVVTDSSTGDSSLVCADGSKVPLPSGFRSCPDLKALFDWDCLDATCP